MAVAATSVAHAQATRTWVSGVGDDVNPCSRTAPCKTFAGAISKTAAGGEINCLDPGGFGTITITKSITIDCRGTQGGILSALAPTAVNVNGTDIVVTLRNLNINAVGTGTDGVRFTNGRRLIIENVTISGVTRYGVWVPTMAGAGNLVISNSSITNGVDGVRVAWGNAMVSHSVLSGNSGFALIAENVGVINADSNILTHNGTALQAGNGGAGQGSATVNISNNDVYSNLNGFACAGGIVASNGTNRKGANTGGAGPVCSPNGTITVQ
jgi:hypothetical protein